MRDQRAIGNDWSRAMFGGDFYLSPSSSPDLPSISLVFVESAEGNTVARNPAALGGGDTDKHVVYEGLSRVAADAVMAGAATIRGGQMFFSVWREELVELRHSLGLPRHPIQIVATLRGVDLDTALLFNTPDLRVIVVTLAAVSDAMHRALSVRPWITTMAMHDATGIVSALRRIRELGVATISCIGGRTLARQMMRAGVVQDLYLTSSAQSGGEPNTPLSAAPIRGRTVLTKRGTGRDEGIRFTHTRLLPHDDDFEHLRPELAGDE